MPHPCVVCGRSRMNPNNREEDYMFFGFPVNYDDRCRQWLEFCCREDLYKLTKKQLLQRMVCSKHFAKSDFLNEYCDRLNCTAVPSIYDPKQSLYNITCVLCARSRKDPPDPDYDGTTFHHFPGEEFRCLKWLDFVGVDSYYRLTRKEILYCYICSHHFDRSQYLPGYNNRLIDHAVPNMRDPDDMTEDEKLSLELEMERKFHSPERQRKLEPLSTEVLESQACAACGRSRADPRNKHEKYKFHPFPAYEIGRCLRWCQFLGREDLLKMSPNQIRKLVLCSKHFLAGQSFQKVGPCDAVPTIKEIEGSSDLLAEPIPTFEDDSLHQPTQKQGKKDHRPLVSSKKPFVMNKPAPLAKKRGKQKRPTSINIPKPSINDTRILRKLPLPPASNNWKVFSNQFQPITIANTLNTIANTLAPITPISNDGKKMILPFPGNLGHPIPVSSLSSIPPGLLIKINLPQTEKKIAKKGRPRKPKEPSQLRSKRRLKTPGSIQNIQGVQLENSGNDELEELLRFSSKFEKDDEPEGTDIAEHDNVEHDDIEEHEHIEALEEIEEMEYIEMEEYLGDVDYDVKDGIEMLCEEDNFQNVEPEFVQAEGSDADVTEDGGGDILDVGDSVNGGAVRRLRGRRKKMTARSRRTLLPIRSEVKGFLKKLKPMMRRLPKRARAKLKLSIVTMVIDHL